MRKILYFLYIMITANMMFSTQALAAEITSIDVEVRLYPDGSAHITEVWTTQDVYEGTQISRIMDLPDTMTILSLEVQDINGNSFEIVRNWVDFNTFEERAGHASVIVTNSGYEIIWGITEHGDNQYRITYVLEGLVQEFTGGVGFYHQFVPFDLSPAPNSVSLHLYADHVDLTYDNLDVYLYGMDGEIDVTNEGILVVYSAEQFTDQNALVLSVEFEAGLFIDITDSSFPWILIGLTVFIVVSLWYLRRTRGHNPSAPDFVDRGHYYNHHHSSQDNIGSFTGGGGSSIGGGGGSTGGGGGSTGGGGGGIR